MGSSEQPTRGGPQACELGEVLTILRRKTVSCYETFTKAQYRDRWRTLVNAVMNLLGSIKCGEFLDKLITDWLLKKTPLRGVGKLVSK
jgi:hypothetical protein